MCLYNPLQIHPENDIICYKVMYLSKTIYEVAKNCEKLKNELIFLASPFFSSHNWQLNHEYEIINEPTIEEIDNTLNDNAFHSFKTLDGAKDLLEFLKLDEPKSDFAIVKCVIPKTAQYVYEGEFNGSKCYASTSLIVKEIIEIQ